MNAMIHTARLTDSMERDLMRGTLENQANTNPMPLLKTLSRAFTAVYSYIAEVNAAMNCARATNAKYSGSQW